jgi:RNA polymerase sigma factor (sigma-70 family)
VATGALAGLAYRIATNEVRRITAGKDSPGLPPGKARRAVREPRVPAAPAARAGTATEEDIACCTRRRAIAAQYRTAIILRYFEDKTIAEIASITGRKEGTIKSQLHRGLAQLQEILVRWGVLPE